MKVEYFKNVSQAIKSTKQMAKNTQRKLYLYANHFGRKNDVEYSVRTIKDVLNVKHPSVLGVYHRNKWLRGSEEEILKSQKSFDIDPCLNPLL